MVPSFFFFISLFFFVFVVVVVVILCHYLFLQKLFYYYYYFFFFFLKVILFFHVPGYSGMFHVTGFIDAPCNLQKVIWGSSNGLNGNGCSLLIFIRSTVPMIRADFLTRWNAITVTKGRDS